jgi:hypothetical protein
MDRLDRTMAEIEELQAAINAWLKDAQAAKTQAGVVTDIERRLSVFKDALGQYLLALGHSAARNRGVGELRLDQGQYEPYLGERRLKSLGSGS